MKILLNLIITFSILIIIIIKNITKTFLILRKTYLNINYLII